MFEPNKTVPRPWNEFGKVESHRGKYAIPHLLHPNVLLSQ